MNDYVEKARNGRVIALAGLSSFGGEGSRNRIRSHHKTVTFVSFRQRQQTAALGA